MWCTSALFLWIFGIYIRSFSMLIPLPWRLEIYLKEKQTQMHIKTYLRMFTTILFLAKQKTLNCLKIEKWLNYYDTITKRIPCSINDHRWEWLLIYIGKGLQYGKKVQWEPIIKIGTREHACVCICIYRGEGKKKHQNNVGYILVGRIPVTYNFFFAPSKCFKFFSNKCVTYIRKCH